MSRRSAAVTLVVFGVGFGAVPTVVPAQGLRQQIEHDLFTFGDCGEPLCLGGSLGGHGEHFIPAAEQNGGVLIGLIASSIAISVSNTPIASSSSGTTFRFEGGVPVKTSTSAGPIFAERAQTLGKGRFFASLNVTSTTFERLRGIPLSNMQFNFTHENVAPTDTMGKPIFENDLVQVQVAFNASTIVSTASLTWGIVDGLDLGVVVPFVHVSESGTSLAQILPISGTNVHFFGDTANPVLTATSSTQGNASGLGDVGARLKINIAQTSHVGVGMFVDARFPTGNADDLLGSGKFMGRGLGIVSATWGNFNPHVNFGYTLRDAPDQNNSVSLVAGFDQLVSSFATMALDVLGDWRVGQNELQIPPPVVYQFPYTRSVNVTNIPANEDNYLSLAFGFKFQTQAGMRIVANGLFPLRNSGMQPSATWTGGIEYNF